jgi:hypothetical protein
MLLTWICLALFSQSPVHGFLSAEASGTLLSGFSKGPLVELTFGYGVRGGIRKGMWGAFLHLEHNIWRPVENTVGLVPGVLNAGVGGELTFASQRIRGTIAMGPSILLFNTPLDSAGSVGVFIDFRPAGIRFHPVSWLTLVLDPIAFSLSAPVLTGIPLVRVQYRTILSAEFGS